MNISKIKEWLKLNRNKVIGVAFILIVLTVAFLSGEKPASVNPKDDKSTENELQSNATSDKVENRYTIKNSNSSDNINQTDNNTNTDVSDSNSEAQDTSAYNDNSKSDNQNGEQNPDLNGNTSQDTDNSAEAKPDSNKTDISSPGTNISDGSNEQNTNGNSNTSTSNNSGNNQNGNTNSDTGSNSGKNENTCTISISCATILNNMSILDKDKKDIVPKDGSMFNGDVKWYDYFGATAGVTFAVELTINGVQIIGVARNVGLIVMMVKTDGKSGEYTVKHIYSND